jgi:hypothetical protein
MAFKPSYGRDRGERASDSTCVRSEEKKRKKDEKTAPRKSQRAEAELPTSQTSTEESEADELVRTRATRHQKCWITVPLA